MKNSIKSFTLIAAAIAITSCGGQKEAEVKTPADVLENNLIVVDKIELEEYKTKSIVNMLKALGVDAKALIVTAQKNEYVVKSAGNIAGVESSNVGMINVYDVINHDKLVIAKDAVEKLEEVYA